MCWYEVVLIINNKAPTDKGKHPYKLSSSWKHPGCLIYSLHQLDTGGAVAARKMIVYLKYRRLNTPCHLYKVSSREYSSIIYLTAGELSSSIVANVTEDASSGGE